MGISYRKYISITYIPKLGCFRFIFGTRKFWHTFFNVALKIAKQCTAQFCNVTRELQVQCNIGRGCPQLQKLKKKRLQDLCSTFKAYRKTCKIQNRIGLQAYSRLPPASSTGWTQPKMLLLLRPPQTTRHHSVAPFLFGAPLKCQEGPCKWSRDRILQVALHATLHLLVSASNPPLPSVSLVGSLIGFGDLGTCTC